MPTRFACLLLAWLAVLGDAHAGEAVSVLQDLEVPGGCYEVESAEVLQTRATELGAALEPLRSPHEQRAQVEAARALSEGHRLRIEEESARLLQEVFGEVLREQGEVCEAAGTSPAGGILPDPQRIYLFVSSSMPLKTLRNYARAIGEIGDPSIPMVLRGFVGGMQHVLPTRRFLLDVVQKDPDCDPDTRGDCELHRVNVIIDPLLFRRFDVEQVPTLVYRRGMSVRNDRSGSEGLPEKARVADYALISGDAALDYLLDRVQPETRSR